MSVPVVTIAPGRTLADALKEMESRNIRRLPVVEGDCLVGIITRSDIYRILGKWPPENGGAGQTLTVGAAMTVNPVTVEADETLERAALLMLDHKISGLPVIHKDKTVGIVTESDIFRFLVKVLGFENRGARVALELGETDDILESIRNRLGDLQVQSLVTYHDSHRGKWSVVVRVRGRTAPIKTIEF